YLKLHAYVRMKLHDKYGDIVPPKGPIPAHLLGNIWAQDWSNTYKLAAPANADPGYNLTDILKRRNTTSIDMVKAGERFYTSLGFAPLPQTFWERSMFVKPRDREVVCHASAWDIDFADDLRVKMCIQPTDEDFKTIHHELGHNFYQRAYKGLPLLFRDSANDGFHEAIGDTIALSVTPEYLVKIGLLDKAPDASRDIGLLLDKALEKIAFLPFGLLIDQWRWKVFSGEIKPEDYNQAWWDLRLKYQGVAPVSPRGEEFFDPGAKYHVAGNVPYTRYFLAFILQFQFLRALSHSLDIVRDLSDEQFRLPLLRTINPLLWEIGHIAYFQEYWVLRHAAGRPAIRPESDSLYDSARIAHDLRWNLPLPSRAETNHYMLEIRDSVLNYIRTSSFDFSRDAYFVLLSVFHEDMHDEALLITRQTLGYPFPTSLERTDAPPVKVSAPGDVFIPAVEYTLGSAYDVGLGVVTEM